MGNSPIVTFEVWKVTDDRAAADLRTTMEGGKGAGGRATPSQESRRFGRQGGERHRH